MSLRVAAGAGSGSGITLTTTGTSGVSTLSGGGVLNIPVYSTGSVVPGLIVGCQPIWTSTTQLSIGSGRLYIESTNTVIAVAASTITPSSPSTDTWYHLYVNNSGTLSASTAVPVPFATPCGYAMSKTGDTANRYVGSALTDGSSHFYRFWVDQSGLYKWKALALDAAPFRCLDNGSATSSTNVSLAGAVPVTARTAYIEIVNVSQVAFPYVSSGDVTVSPSAFDLNAPVASSTTNAVVLGFVPVDSSQTINYINAVGSGAAYIDVYGFYLQR